MVPADSFRPSSVKRSIKRDVGVDVEGASVVIVDIVADPLLDEELLLDFQDAAAGRRDSEEDAEVSVEAHSDEDPQGSRHYASGCLGRWTIRTC
jgi:hypothetical protein